MSSSMGRMIPYMKWKIIHSCSKPPTRYMKTTFICQYFGVFAWIHGSCLLMLLLMAKLSGVSWWISSPDGVGGGAGCDWKSSLEGTPYPTCHVHGSNISTFHGKSWKPMVFKDFETQHQPRIYCFAAFATRIHDFSVLNWEPTGHVVVLSPDLRSGFVWK